MATRKKITPQQIQSNNIVIAMAVLLALYGILLALWAVNIAGALAGVFSSLRLGLLFAVISMGCTWLYLRAAQKPVAARVSSGSNTSGANTLKREVETWVSQLADALKNKSSFEELEITAGIEELKNSTKLSNAWNSVLTEMANLQADKQRTAGAIAQKEKQVKSLEETLTVKNGEITKSKGEAEAALRQLAQQKQELSTLTTEAEKQRKEAGSKMDRYRNISKFLESAKSTLYSQHGGKDFLVQLKLGLLADDVINLTNKNDYFSLNYELFRNGRSFEQLVKEQPPVHIDAYPDSVKKLRAWIKASGLEGENWDLFYQNYPVTDRVVR